MLGWDPVGGVHCTDTPLLAGKSKFSHHLTTLQVREGGTGPAGLLSELTASEKTVRSSERYLTRD